MSSAEHNPSSMNTTVYANSLQSDITTVDSNPSSLEDTRREIRQLTEERDELFASFLQLVSDDQGDALRVIMASEPALPHIADIPINSSSSSPASVIRDDEDSDFDFDSDSDSHPDPSGEAGYPDEPLSLGLIASVPAELEMYSSIVRALDRLKVAYNIYHGACINRHENSSERDGIAHNEVVDVFNILAQALDTLRMKYQLERTIPRMLSRRIDRLARILGVVTKVVVWSNGRDWEAVPVLNIIGTPCFRRGYR